MFKIPSATLFLGKNLMILPECPSTNTIAGELSQSDRVGEGTVVITHHQTAGRGQRGNSWESEKGLNLTLSVILHPVFLAASRQFQLNKTVSLAICDTVSQFTAHQVKVKWPNDIMIEDGKTCGILIENQLVGSQISRSIVGIGLNVNQSSFISSLATAISLHANARLSLQEVFEKLMQSLEWRYLQLKNDQHELLNEDYLAALYRANETRKYLAGDREFEGIIKGVDASGRLLIEDGTQFRSFDLKEIKYVY